MRYLVVLLAGAVLGIVAYVSVVPERTAPVQTDTLRVEVRDTVHVRSVRRDSIEVYIEIPGGTTLDSTMTISVRASHSGDLSAGSGSTGSAEIVAPAAPIAPQTRNEGLVYAGAFAGVSEHGVEPGGLASLRVWRGLHADAGITTTLVPLVGASIEFGEILGAPLAAGVTYGLDRSIRATVSIRIPL